MDHPLIMIKRKFMAQFAAVLSDQFGNMVGNGTVASQ
jgi:hypothetical protein